MFIWDFRDFEFLLIDLFVNKLVGNTEKHNKFIERIYDFNSDSHRLVSLLETKLL